MCFIRNYRYHNTLIGNIKELLRKLDAFCSNYQHVECLYTFFKYRFSCKIVVKSGELFDNVQSALHFNLQNRGVDRLARIAKKRFLRKKDERHLLSSFQKTKSTQTGGSVLEDRIEQIKKTKFEFDLIKSIDCFLEAHSNYTRYLMFFKKNLCKLSIFLIPKRLV